MSGIATATLLPEPPRRRQDEAKFQAAFAEFLDVALPTDAVAHHSPGEGLRSKRAQAELVRSGFCRGWPDIEIIWRSKAYFIELKAARGVVSKAQRETHRRLINAGVPVMVCKSVEECERGLRALGLPLRATVLAA